MSETSYCGQGGGEMGRKEGLEPGREEGQEEWAGGRGLDRVPYGPGVQQETSAGQSHLPTVLWLRHHGLFIPGPAKSPEHQVRSDLTQVRSLQGYFGIGRCCSAFLHFPSAPSEGQVSPKIGCSQKFCKPSCVFACRPQFSKKVTFPS